jgi:hypothetical protein
MAAHERLRKRSRGLRSGDGMSSAAARGRKCEQRKKAGLRRVRLRQPLFGFLFHIGDVSNRPTWVLLGEIEQGSQCSHTLDLEC